MIPPTKPLDKRNAYWRGNLRITIALLVLWILVTYVVAFFGRELNEITLFGFPFGFYMGAQGSLLIYLAIVWFYARYMDRLDRQYGVPSARE